MKEPAPPHMALVWASGLAPALLFGGVWGAAARRALTRLQPALISLMTEDHRKRINDSIRDLEEALRLLDQPKPTASVTERIEQTAQRLESIIAHGKDLAIAWDVLGQVGAIDIDPTWMKQKKRVHIESALPEIVNDVRSVL